MFKDIYYMYVAYSDGFREFVSSLKNTSKEDFETKSKTRKEKLYIKVYNYLEKENQ